MSEKKVELLAPAGNMEAFYGAIAAGADAVYLGGEKFGARAYADNFSEEELIEGIRYAHIWGRRVYLTVNTLMKENELQELYDYLRPYYEAGLDGVIVQDIGAFVYIREHFPGMELHVSTQMTLTGRYSAELLKEMGACRIVPARELSLAEIREIKESTGLEIETFIHGAMCYCYSGQCLFSSILGGRSGNRGRCAQPCRLPYQVETDGKQTGECYPLSLKDMCTIEHLPELIEGGIDSFKIEGRMKKPEYAAGVTAVYRKYIDWYYAHPGRKFLVAREDLEKLSHLYIRSERQDGYYYKHNGADMVTLDSPAYSGSEEGLLENIRERYLNERPRLEIEIYADFSLGKPAQVTFLCEGLSATVTGTVVQKAQKQPISQENIEKQLKKLGETVFHCSQIMTTVSVNAFYPLKEINELRRMAAAELEKQLIEHNGLVAEREVDKRSRIGQTAEQASEASAGQKSELTEEKAAALESETKAAGLCKTSVLPALNVMVRTVEQLEAVCEQLETGALTLHRIYLDGDMYGNVSGNMQGDISGNLAGDLQRSLQTGDRASLFGAALERMRGKVEECFIALTPILRKRDADYLEEMPSLLQLSGVDGCMVRSLEGYAYLRKNGYTGRIAADAGFYIWNGETVRYWEQEMVSYCLPYELNAREQHMLLQNASGKAVPEKIIYGRIPMMVTANCVAKTTGSCRGGAERRNIILHDRYQKQFPVVVNCAHCMNTIYNSVPLSLHRDCGKWSREAMLRLDFTIEDKQQTRQITSYFQGLLNGGKSGMGSDEPPFREYTTGHEKRGVE